MFTSTNLKKVITKNKVTDSLTQKSKSKKSVFNKKIQIATGGTTPILLYRAATNEIEKISDISDPVGVEKKTEYQDKDFSVEPDDIIITYTDGVIEAPNNRGIQYSKDRLLEVILANKHLSGKVIAEKVKNDIVRFTGLGSQHDDQTLLIIKIQ